MSTKKTSTRPADPAVKDRERGAFEASVIGQQILEQLKVLTAQARGPPEAFTLSEFCEWHGISLSMLYKLTNQHKGPETFFCGTRVLVSKEAAAKWRAAREAESKAPTAA